MTPEPPDHDTGCRCRACRRERRLAYLRDYNQDYRQAKREGRPTGRTIPAWAMPICDCPAPTSYGQECLACHRPIAAFMHRNVRPLVFQRWPSLTNQVPTIVEREG